MITTGHVQEPFAASRLVALCALSLHGDLNYAAKLFDQVENPNLFTWNAMIRGFSRSNVPECCFLFYADMLGSGCVPDGYTFPFLLKACMRVLEVQQVHAHVLKFGFSSDSFAANALIRMYVEFGWIETAELVFERMSERDETVWEAMVVGLASRDYAAEALRVFRSRQWRKMEVGQVILGSALSACARVGDLKLGEEIHRYIREENVGIGMVLRNSLMNMYCKCGRVETARSVFEGMQETDLISWSTLISGYLENGCLDQSLELVTEMEARNVRGDEGTFLSLILACEQLDFGLVIHNLIKRMDFESSLTICSALTDMYSRIGHVELGRKVFDMMPRRDIVTWNSMLAGYVRSGSMQMARNIFNQMPKKDNYSWSTMIAGYVKDGLPEKAMGFYRSFLMDRSTKPDRITILNALTACLLLGALEEGESIHRYLVRSGMCIDATLGTALIDMYAKCGCLEKAIQVFEGLLEKDVLVWTALISCLAMHGRGKEALMVFYQMQSLGDESLKLNSVTFLSVLSACVHAGPLEDGWEIYRRMRSVYRVEPEMQHNGCMIDLLGRAGLLKEAMQFIEGLGPMVDVDMWGALLNACRIHGNVELGEVAARRILELEPMHGGAHVLMSNIYVEAGRPRESMELRKKMRQDDVEKQVGRIWIQVNGVRHEFTAREVLSEFIERG